MSVVTRNIYRILNEKCLSQSKVGIKSGYGVKNFNAMLRERKTIKDEDVIRIAVALGVDPKDLFVGYDKASPQAS